MGNLSQSPLDSKPSASTKLDKGLSKTYKIFQQLSTPVTTELLPTESSSTFSTASSTEDSTETMLADNSTESTVDNHSNTTEISIIDEQELLDEHNTISDVEKPAN